MKNVYFVGKAGSGKTSCTKHLQEKYGYKTAKFAYPVYHIAEDYFGMKEKDRKVLQIIGTDAGRYFINPDMWVNRFKEDMEIVILTSAFLGLSVPNFCSDDVRFNNEHLILKSMGWTGIYIYCDDDIRFKRLENRDGYTQEKFNNHSSETSIDYFCGSLIQIDGGLPMKDMLDKLDIIIREK